MTVVVNTFAKIRIMPLVKLICIFIHSENKKQNNYAHLELQNSQVLSEFENTNFFKPPDHKLHKQISKN